MKKRLERFNILKIPNYFVDGVKSTFKFKSKKTKQNILKKRKKFKPEKKITGLFKIKSRHWFKTLIISLIIIFIGLIIIYSGIITPVCKNDKCFNEKFNKCSPAKYTSVKNNNLYEYKIYRSLFSTCNMKVTMKKVATGTDIDIVNAIQGKSMQCKIPKNLTQIDFADLENLTDYCTGPLKEGIYEIVLNRMYGLIVSQMGDIVKEAKSALTQF